MTRRISIVATALVVLASGAAAQLPAARASAAATERVSADTATTSFETSGVRVILRRSAANDVVAANLYLLGGNQLVTPQTAGIEPFLLWASERGTRHYSRDALRQKMASLGSTIVVEPRDDWTMYGFRGVREAFDSTWTVFADRLIEPTLDPQEVEIVREQVLNAVRQRNDSPDDLVQSLADSMLFAGQPYSLPSAGGAQSLSHITVAELKKFHDAEMMTSRMLLVVVGDVQREQLERLIGATFGKLPHGDYRWAPPPDPSVRPSAALLVQRPLPTNYILGYYLGPRSTSPDYQALRIATAVLGGRLFTEIRSRRNLTYDVNTPFVERAISSGGLYVTTAYPDTALAIMQTEIRHLQTGLVDPENLEAIVQQFLTEYFLNNETNAEQANFLARAQLYRGDYREADRFVDELRAVTPQDVRAAARKYMHNVSFAYVGDTTHVSRPVIQGF